MKLSVLPILIAAVFVFCVAITRRARSRQAITAAGARSLYAFLAAVLVWAGIAVVMGVQGIHVELMDWIPLLWQAMVVVVIVNIAFVISPTFRAALRGLVTSTPWHWLVFIQALRIGALGGIIKGVKGEVTSDFVFWIGGPDFLFGLSALVVGWLVLRNAVSNRFLVVWNLVGFSLILFPTFLPTNYWMNEPGFSFIFEFPMVMAPAVVVPIFISLNLLHAWGAILKGRTPALS